MVLRQTLTPETFLAAPRRSAAVPSPSGRVAFYTVSTHTFIDDGNVKGTTRKELFLLDLATGKSWPFFITDDSSNNDVTKLGEMAWVPGSADELLWLRPKDNGSTEVVMAKATYSQSERPAFPPYVAGHVNAPIRALRLKALPDGSVAFAVAGQVGTDGQLYNEKAPVQRNDIPVEDRLIDLGFDPSDPVQSSFPDSTSPPPQPGSSARIYDTWQVRSWDRYLPPQPFSIWYGSLTRQPSLSTLPEDPAFVWSLSTLHNALQHAPPRFEAPFGIFDQGDPVNAYDIGAQGVVFVIRDPAPANMAHTSCTEVYYVPLDSFSAPTAYKPARIRVSHSTANSGSSPGSSPGGTSACPPGVSENPRFSPDGTMLAFLWAPLDCPADLRVHLGHIVSGSVHDVSIVLASPGEEAALVSRDGPVPFGFEFAPSGKAVFLEAHDCGRKSLFVMDLKAGARPRRISGSRGSVNAYHLIRREGRRPDDDRLSSYSVLISGSSFVESRFFHIVDLEDDSNADVFEPRVIATANKDGARFGLNYDKQVSEMYFEGGGLDASDGQYDQKAQEGSAGYFVQAWVVRPSNHGEPGSPVKLPLALLVHGGPESAFDDEWHLRWNAACWAEQGYAVVLPNITGSLGFGLDHTTRIYNNWGGSPYLDLEKCMAALKDVPDIDCSRAIVAGGSYGGYMVSWLHGSPLGRQFNAAVCHDPVFSTEFMGLTSDYPDGIATFSGTGYAWENNANIQRYNPARPDRIATWKKNAAPTLVVHSDLDYRCVVTEGQSVFRALLFQGIPARYLNFSDECHFVLKPENALVWHRVVFDWLQRWRDVKRTTGPAAGVAELS